MPVDAWDRVSRRAGVVRGDDWSDRLLKWAFWGLNLGLAGMMLLSLLPAGLYQFSIAIAKGTWYARSPAVTGSAFLHAATWARVGAGEGYGRAGPRRVASTVAMAAPSGTQQQARAENAISGALRQLFALSEAYPDLKANQNFGQLQEELTGTEDRIAYSRQFFNDSVLRYNNKIQAFPGVILANAMGFKAREYFEADDDSRGPVQVTF